MRVHEVRVRGHNTQNRFSTPLLDTSARNLATMEPNEDESSSKSKKSGMNLTVSESNSNEVVNVSSNEAKNTTTEIQVIDITAPGEETTANESSNNNDNNFAHSVIRAALEWIKYICSTALLIFSTVLVMAAIFSSQTVGTSDSNIAPIAAFFIFWFLILWLAMMEGGQGALVGLKTVDKDRYAESHPRTLRNTRLVHKGDNMERFIVGRQFLVVLVVFLTNTMGTAIPGADVLNLPGPVLEIFLGSGLAMILVTTSLGQLTAQVNSANHMLDFTNNYFILFTAYVSLTIEFSGLLHCVYLVTVAFSLITGKPVESAEPPRTPLQNVFFWGRVVMSLAILGFAFAVTLEALFKGQTLMWEGVPPGVSIVIFFLLMFFVGLMEGMQIALFAVMNLEEDELAKYSIAHKNCKLTMSGNNLQAFLIGRQICVTICMFVVAQITSISVAPGEENIFGVSDGLQEFFNAGLLGAVITTIVGSLIWRIIGSSFPLPFLSNPLIYIIIRLCLFLEASGICAATWLLALLLKKIFRYKDDDVYIGSPMERAESRRLSMLEKDEDDKVSAMVEDPRAYYESSRSSTRSFAHRVISERSYRSGEDYNSNRSTDSSILSVLESMKVQSSRNMMVNATNDL